MLGFSPATTLRATAIARSSTGSPGWMPWRQPKSQSLSRASNRATSRAPRGEGVLEYRIDWGPGYRVYFGRDGDVLLILLTGDTKKRQQHDIKNAKGM